MNALRWSGRSGWYEVWYLVVSGRAWLRYTLHVGDAEEAALWLVTWDGAPRARKETFPFEAFTTGAAGWPLELGPARLSDDAASGPDWELRLRPLAPPRDALHALVRPLASTRLALAQPVVEVTGTIGGIELDGALGSQAHVWGTRHAERFAWAHAGARDGRWLELLTAKVPRLPEISQVADRRRTRFARATVDGGTWRIGGYEVRADPDDVAGVTYRDPDGTPLYCYHAERARLTGPGVDVADASFELATRDKLPQWTLLL